MNEFEMEMLSFMKSVDKRLSAIESDVSVLKSDVSVLKSDVSVLKSDVLVLKSDVSDMKEDLEITRTATNYSGEKLEELTEELKKANIIS